ncbi:MAG TPA: response regulator [Terriglobales bacterium]|nr:response regulator [Terriglobales bacterium]
MSPRDSAPRTREVLLAEDDEVFRQRLAAMLRNKGFKVTEAPDAASAHSCIRTHSLSFAIVDLRLPGGSGLDIVRELADKSSKIRTIVLTGFGSIATALAALRLGAVDYLTKPATVEQICGALIPEEVSSAAEVRGADPVPSLARVEWEHINRILSDVGGNISEAARLLGIHRRSLQRKLAKFPTRR